MDYSTEKPKFLTRQGVLRACKWLIPLLVGTILIICFPYIGSKNLRPWALMIIITLIIFALSHTLTWADDYRRWQNRSR